MTLATSLASPSGQVIQALMHREHSLFIQAKDMAHALPADITSLDLKTGSLVLEVYYSGDDIERYLDGGTLSFDVEAISDDELFEREIFSLSRVSTRVHRTDTSTYRLECTLPQTVFVKEKRGDIRVPFIMGMHTRVNVEVYLHELSVTGHLRNLSSGGCLIDIRLEESISLTVNQRLPGVTLEFPNGESFFAEGWVRHIRPYGSYGHAAIGLQFLDLSPHQTEALLRFVAESEREAIYRTGASEKITHRSPLFVAGAKERNTQQREQQERQKRSKQSPMLRGVLEVAQQLQVILMFLKNRHMLAEETLYDCADTLIYLIKQDRKSFSFALSHLLNQAEWVRHSVQTAAQLADMLLMRDPHSLQVREAVVGALLQMMGKPLLLSEQLPSLKTNMKPYQKQMLKGHTQALLTKLNEVTWQPSPTCRDVLENANERLDGQGYPNGKRGNEIPEFAQLLSVIKIINKLTHERNGSPPRSPLDAYRWVNSHPEAYNKAVLVEYIQLYGLYPIGSLAKFSGGFLGWIMDIDSKGMPRKILVVKNLRFQDTTIDTVIGEGDFSQIGKFEGVVNPADYGVTLDSK
jgi:response regulator RpfG family c-di-GMP phosphodiesterase